MNTINQSTPPAGKSKTWIILALVGLFGCICIVVVGVVLGLGIRSGKWVPPSFENPVQTEEPASIATQEPQLLPTDTPLPPIPTDTLVPTVAPTFTAAPTQSISTIVEALRDAAEGRGVPEAAAYDSQKSGVHPIVIFSADADIVTDWNAELPDAWRAQSVSLAELVAVVTNQQVKIDRGHYFGKGISLYVWSIRIDTEVILRETRTGATVAAYTFPGGDPPALKSSYPVGTTAVYGTLVAYETVELWLKSFVEK